MPGCCDGNPEDDLKLPNGTVVREVGDMMLFLQAWRVQTTDDTEHTRRVGDNCTTGDCSICLSMLRQRAFTPCHSKVATVFTMRLQALLYVHVCSYFVIIVIYHAERPNISNVRCLVCLCFLSIVMLIDN